MTLRRALAAACLLPVLAVALAAPVQAASGAPSGGRIVGDWTTSTDGVAQTVTFTRDGKINGDGGCNRFLGEYSVDGSSIDIGQLATTLMYCEGVMDAERALLKALEKSASYSVQGAKLTLFGPKGKATVRLTAA